MRFADGTLRRFWKNGRAKGIDPRSAERLEELLSALDAAARPEDMVQPGWDFHPLTGDRKGQFAVEIRGSFRLVFEWEEGLGCSRKTRGLPWQMTHRSAALAFGPFIPDES